MPVEIDLDQVRRQRLRGMRTLGQPLKSFRDSTVHFGVYDAGCRPAYLDSLGPLEKPRAIRNCRGRARSRSRPWPPNDRGDVPGGRRGPARGGPAASSSSAPGPPIGPGTCARARPPAPPSSSAGGCCASTCPSCCRPGSGWSSWSAAATSRPGSCRSTTRRRSSPAAPRPCGPTAAPALVRNYDYAPHQFDGLILRSACNGTAVSGDERLRLGRAGRRQRARARRFPGLWRPPPGWRRLRDHGRAALHSRFLHARSPRRSRC